MRVGGGGYPPAWALGSTGVLIVAFELACLLADTLGGGQKRTDVVSTMPICSFRAPPPSHRPSASTAATASTPHDRGRQTLLSKTKHDTSPPSPNQTRLAQVCGAGVHVCRPQRLRPHHRLRRHRGQAAHRPKHGLARAVLHPPHSLLLPPLPLRRPDRPRGRAVRGLPGYDARRGCASAGPRGASLCFGEGRRLFGAPRRLYWHAPGGKGVRRPSMPRLRRASSSQPKLVRTAYTP